MCPNLWLVLFSCVYIKSTNTICLVYINTDLFYKVSRHITVELLQQFSSSLSPALQNKHNIVQHMCHFGFGQSCYGHTILCLPSQFCYWWEKSCRKDQSMTRIKSIFYIVQSNKFIHNHTITKNLFKIVTKTRQWLAGQWLYLFPTSSPDTLCPSTMVKAPIPKKQSKNNVNNNLYEFMSQCYDLRYTVRNTDTWQHKVFEYFSASRSGVDETHMGIFKCFLSMISPQPDTNITTNKWPAYNIITTIDRQQSSRLIHPVVSDQ